MENMLFMGGSKFLGGVHIKAPLIARLPKISTKKEKKDFINKKIQIGAQNSMNVNQLTLNLSSKPIMIFLFRACASLRP